MNFATSTHKRDWLFEADALAARYAAAQLEAVEAMRAPADDADAGPDAKKQRADPPISVEEEAMLKLFFAVKLKAICAQQQLPSKVLNAGLLFFKRFYTQASCLEHDPMRVMPTCIYLACKVEESYRSAESLCKQLGIEAGPVLRFEVPLLQGLRFDLVVHSPYRALAGLFKELDELRAQQSQQLDAQLRAAPSQSLAAAHAKARHNLDVLVMSDAPLLHPPGLLAVAALRSGFRGLQLSCHDFLRHVAHRSLQLAAAGGQPPQQALQPAQELEQAMLSSLAQLEELAGAQQDQMDEAALQAKATEVDRAIKLWRKRIASASKQGGDSSGAPPPSGHPAAAMVTG